MDRAGADKVAMADDPKAPSGGASGKPTVSKVPRTARGERTRIKILDAALSEFGERGYSEASISAITRRAGVALGTFYTYFDSKESVFQALVGAMSERVRDHVAPSLGGARDALDGEQRALHSFLEFVTAHRQVYRIIDEAEFVDPEGFRRHYETTAARIAARLAKARDKGDVDPAVGDRDLDVLAWALMGANVFLGLRFAVWGREDPARVAAVAGRLVRSGIGPRGSDN